MHFKKGIIFDLDGTLWDSSAQVIPAWNTVLAKYNQRNITAEDMVCYMGKTLEMIAELVLPKLSHKQAMNIMYECCKEEQIYLRQHGGILYTDVPIVLRELKQHYQLFIVSNCQTDYLNAFFTAHHKLKEYFTDYECNGNTGLPKSENIKIIIERNNLKKAFYVGDTELDGKAAHAVGIPFVFADYGFGKCKEYEFIIETFSDLLRIF